MSLKMVYCEEDESIQQFQEIQIPIQLPGQAVSDEKSEEERSTDDEFDLDKFRKNDNNYIHTKRSAKKILDRSDKNQQLEQISSKEQQYFKYLGIKFNLRKIQKRNKDPKLFLNTIITLQSVEMIGAILMIFFGSKYKVISIVFHILFKINLIFLILSFITDYFMSKFIIQILFFLGSLACSTGEIMFWFFFDILFGNIAYFLLSIEIIIGFFGALTLALVVLPNQTPFDDQNYQTKFFFSRIILAIINSMGFLDVISDIVLGFELINKFQGFLKIMGISLFLLCLMDFLIVNIRLMQPKKVTVQMHLGAIILEVAILIFSVITFFKFSENQQYKNQEVEQNNDFFGLLVLSLVTTLINFVHHIFVIFEQQVNEQGQKIGINISVLYV